MSHMSVISTPVEGNPQLPAAARRAILAFAFIGLMVLAYSVITWESPDLFKFGGFLVVALFSAGMRIQPPGKQGFLSLTFLFILFGMVELTPSESLVLAATMALAQRFWMPGEKTPLLSVFRTVQTVAATAVAERVYHSDWLLHYGFESAARLVCASFALFLICSTPAALVTAWTEAENFTSVWRTGHLWAFPYYLGGAVVAQLMVVANDLVGWQTVLLTGPVIYLIYRSYRLYLERLDEERRHADDVSSLHLRTIEALALAIEAKDHTTHDHLQRVQVYAIELAKELNLSHDEQEALRAAALLHDIGKLAVPEHIISKPGRLTPEEFEKMKIHPVVGAEILERVRFPYPVVPIVLSHHEKWDGSGYPYGIAGEEIPIGARILSAVDCLDALATDRQYRRALPLDEAMKVVVSESGRAFDPKVVTVLSRRYIDLEQKAQIEDVKASKRNPEVKVRAGLAPAAGFETAAEPDSNKNGSTDFLTSIAAARHEVQALFEISQDLGNSLSLDETLSVLGVRLRRMIPHHSMAIWIRRENVLRPEYVHGEDYRILAGLEIPVGDGLSGWVAENRKPILNGNPAVEPGYTSDGTKPVCLRSAVAVPLDSDGGVLGVLSLYHTDRDAFTKDHLRILLGISAKIGMSIENALRFRQVESSATTDFLTSLPNARSLFLQLDAEVARSRRENQPLTVLVLDLDGFKAVNDRLGHVEGNKMLGAVGLGLRAACREYDYVARMGGDEFVVLLPGVRPADVDGKIAQFRQVVTNASPVQLQGVRISASVGIAHYPSDGADAETLLAEADRRMYQEKRGRSQSRSGPRPVLVESGVTVSRVN